MGRFQDFLNGLKAHEWSAVARKWVLDVVPYVFGANVTAYAHWRYELSAQIDVDPSNIKVVGSAATGFSLNPQKGYKRFDANSDVDVAIVSHYYFEEAWRYMRNLGTGLYGLPMRAKHAIQKHQSGYVYWGTVATDMFLEYLPFGIDWAKALSSSSRNMWICNRTVNARIYRDYESLSSYTEQGLAKLRRK